MPDVIKIEFMASSSQLSKRAAKSNSGASKERVSPAQSTLNAQRAYSGIVVDGADRAASRAMLHAVGFSSDAKALWKSGFDARCALIGPGVDDTHGYERTHVDALVDTTKLIAAFLRDTHEH